MQLRLKPEHPDVIHQKRTIADCGSSLIWRPPLRSSKQRNLLRFRLIVSNRTTHSDRAGAPQSSRAWTPDYEKEQEEPAAGRHRGIQNRVDSAPSRESDLVELTRDYGTLQATYQSLLRKKETRSCPPISNAIRS